jgi:hypothetical protein
MKCGSTCSFSNELPGTIEINSSRLGESNEIFDLIGLNFGRQFSLLSSDLVNPIADAVVGPIKSKKLSNSTPLLDRFFLDPNLRADPLAGLAESKVEPNHIHKWHQQSNPQAVAVKPSIVLAAIVPGHAEIPKESQLDSQVEVESEHVEGPGANPLVAIFNGIDELVLAPA